MPGTPNYPKDQGTEWMRLKRAVNDVFTSANKRVPFQKIGAGILSVFQSIQVQAGAFMSFEYAGGIEGLFMGRTVNAGDQPVDAFLIRRADGTAAIWSFSRVEDGFSFTAIYDQSNNVIFSDDGLGEQGIARPWIPLTFVNTAELTSPPSARQTTSTSDTAVVTAFIPVQHPYLYFQAYVENPGGGTVQYKFKNLSNGTTMFTGTSTGGFVSGNMELGPWTFGEETQIDLTIRRSAGSGAVGITLLALVGRQTP